MKRLLILLLLAAVALLLFIGSVDPSKFSEYQPFIKWMITVIWVGIFVAGLVVLWVRPKKEIPTVEVLLSDQHYWPTIPLKGAAADASDVIRVEPHTLSVPRDATFFPMNVIVRNTSRTTIQNATISIIGNRPITPKTKGAQVFSDSIFTIEKSRIHSFQETEEGTYISLDVPVSDPVTLVTLTTKVIADNLPATEYMGVLSVIKNGEPAR